MSVFRAADWRTATRSVTRVIGTWAWLSGVVAVSLTLALRPTWTDWEAYRDGAGQLVSENWWHLYADQPRVQVGPLGLVFGWLPETAAQVVGAVLVVPAVLMLERVARRPVPVPSVVVAIGWAVTAVHVQPADIAVVLCAMAAAVAARDGSSWAVGLLLGSAAGVKPWGLFLAPLILALSRGRMLAGALVAGITALAYGAFVLDQGTWAAGLPQMGVNLGSLLRPFADQAPPWVRPAQLVACWLVAALVARRRGWMSVLLAVAVTRLALDPSSYPYQALAPLAGAALMDAAMDRVQVSLVALGLLLASSPWLAVNVGPVAIGSRAALLAVLLGVAATWPTGRPSGQRPDSGLPSTPGSASYVRTGQST